MTPSGTEILAGVLDNERFMEVNPALAELMGPEPAQLTGVSIRELLAPELADSDLADPSVHRCGLRTDGLPWCASFVLWQPPGWGDQAMLSGSRRFGPNQWRRTASYSPPTSMAGIDSVISHDLRGALRGGSGFVKVVKRAVDDPQLGGLHDRLTKASDHLDIAARSLGTADEIAEKVVEHLRWSERAFLFEPVDFNALVRQAADQSNEAFDGPSADLHLDDCPLVTADQEHLRWVIAELITNSRKFTTSPVRIDVLPEILDRFVIIRFKDDGIGIAPDLAGDAVLAGRKLQARADYPGVGMGLSICQVLLERHAGWVRVEPGDGPGTTIAIRLPLSLK